MDQPEKYQEVLQLLCTCTLGTAQQRPSHPLLDHKPSPHLLQKGCEVWPLVHHLGTAMLHLHIPNIVYNPGRN